MTPCDGTSNNGVSPIIAIIISNNIMSKVCKECGHQMDDNVQACPNCGCPVENASASAFVNKDVLNQGKSTEAESIISDLAVSILKWGDIAAKIVPIFAIFNSIVSSIGLFYGGSILGGIFVIIAGVVGAVLCYYIIKIAAKLIWATIMLFVNISTTLKRIETKLDEQNGTH